MFLVVGLFACFPKALRYQETFSLSLHRKSTLYCTGSNLDCACFIASQRPFLARYFVLFAHYVYVGGWRRFTELRTWQLRANSEVERSFFLRLRILLIADLTRSCCCMLVPRSLGHSLVLLGFLLCFLLCCLLSFRQPCVAKAGDLFLFLETKAFCFALCLWNFFAVFCSVHDYHAGYGFEAPAVLVLWFSRLVGCMCGCILS